MRGELVAKQRMNMHLHGNLQSPTTIDSSSYVTYSFRFVSNTESEFRDCLFGWAFSGCWQEEQGL